MQKITHLQLLGVLGLAIVAGGYYFFAELRQNRAPEIAIQGPADEQGSVDDVQVLLHANGCLGCHAIDKKVVGPAYRDVAARYKGDDEALFKLTNSIRKGSVEKWGDAMMPALPNLTETQAQLLAGFVLQQ